MGAVSIRLQEQRAAMHTLHMNIHMNISIDISMNISMNITFLLLRANGSKTAQCSEYSIVRLLQRSRRLDKGGGHSHMHEQQHMQHTQHAPLHSQSTQHTQHAILGPCFRCPFSSKPA